jgi:hypothetical protein
MVFDRVVSVKPIEQYRKELLDLFKVEEIFEVRLGEYHSTSETILQLTGDAARQLAVRLVARTNPVEKRRDLSRRE